ncbi:hypothetical protein MAM1_0041d02910 [Mucor ambiguus]|uniref:Uncharacterized protein n=1 Tax=Mucor ambiguus TaxID=91626 RepID=A0A0C9MJW7_9FUNG|nr:hypothetical protein MAM1_0041d02910 [Mucor ambiguus]
MADDNGAAKAVEAKVINGHAKQEAIDQMMLPYPNCKIQRNLDKFEACFLTLKAVQYFQNSTKQLLSSSGSLMAPSLNFLGTKKTS